MVTQNKTRLDLERFRKLIDDYNSGSRNVETFFQRLMDFAKELYAEQKRGVAESLTEEKLTIFDLLTKPAVELTPAERNQVKKAAMDMLEILKAEKLVLDWRNRQQTRAQVKVGIETSLDA
jgi:type I restriction enzyme R subunit